jgi:endonuclease/exonuclease/phosphatase family metal-dependent hydrolase
MAKAFSVASWNVEHFGDSRNIHKINDCVQFMADQNPDVLAIYEVKSSRVFRPFMEAMPNHQFFITEGDQAQEIMVGVRRTIQAYITQKVQFKSGQSTLRPGVLVTVFVDGEYYPLLFLHLKSMNDPKGFGLRNDMITRAFDFRVVLNKAAKATAEANGEVPKPVNYIFMGDLNTMGLNYYPRDTYDISSEGEIAELHRKCRYRDMKVLSKNHEFSYNNGSQSTIPPSNLDHVVAADHLSFKQYSGAEVDMRGWCKEPDVATTDAWIGKYSDHALLYFEVQK